jgi:hypothetical protein
MKTKTPQPSSPLSGPLLEKITERDKANKEANFPTPSVGSKPLDPPDLYQDPGNGYNKNRTYPQE